VANAAERRLATREKDRGDWEVSGCGGASLRDGFVIIRSSGCLEMEQVPSRMS